MPPIIITQHIPASFSSRFAKRLNNITPLTVKEASDRDPILTGHVYIAPGNRHLTAIKQGAKLVCKLLDTEEVNRHKPSVEVMFNSLNKVTPWRVTAILLTGMGEDGSLAMKPLADAGSLTIAQDEATSLVWGMPGAAVRYQSAKEIISLPKMPQRLLDALSDNSQGKAS